MKRAILTILLLVALGFLAACGGGNGSSSKRPSGLKKRAFVSNAYMGSIDIVDYTSQQQSRSSIGSFSTPGLMFLTPDRNTTLVTQSGTNAVAFVDNNSETFLGSVSIPAATNSIVVSPDSKTAWAATRNAPVDNGQSGAVQVVDLTKGTLGTQIAVPLAQTLALSPDGKKLLVFSDQSDQISYIDLTQTSPVAVFISGNMSRPFSATFSSDGSKAFVANCGPECGGAGAAGITVLDMTGSVPVPGVPVAVDAASTILADGSNLYVAGTKLGSANGSLTVLNTSGSTLTKSAGPVAIGTGTPNVMAVGPNGKLFIGATGCSDAANVENAGCLTIYNTGNGTTKVTSGGSGRVTSIAAVPNKNLVYVVTGGELLTYDTTTDAIFTGPCTNPFGSCFIDIFGAAFDVKIIDQ